MDTDRKLKISFPGAIPELLAKAERAALDFFTAVGTTPYLAAHAHWRAEGHFEFGYGHWDDKDAPAAEAWDQIDSVVAEAVGKPWAVVELVSPSEEATGAPELSQRCVSAQRVSLIEDLSGLEFEQRPGVPF